MQVLRGLVNVPKFSEGCVATIGNFDGVHIGHQALIKRTVKVANRMGLPSVLMLFEPQPLEYFKRDDAPVRLMRLREKLYYLQMFDVDYLCCVAFNQWLAELTAYDFIQQVLLARLSVKQLLVGEDFRFGEQRRGDVAMLSQVGKLKGFGVESLAPVFYHGDRVSSSGVRTALSQDNLALAAQLLGRPYSLSGRVIGGDKRGRQWGIATANIPMLYHQTAVYGVYIVRVAGLAGELLPGVANIGQRPTVDGQCTLLEVHLLDFDGDIYGQRVTVNFVEKIRPEQKFADVEQLKKRILQDITMARVYFERA